MNREKRGAKRAGHSVGGQFAPGEHTAPLAPELGRSAEFRMMHGIERLTPDKPGRPTFEELADGAEELFDLAFKPGSDRALDIWDASGKMLASSTNRVSDRMFAVEAGVYLKRLEREFSDRRWFREEERDEFFAELTRLREKYEQMRATAAARLLEKIGKSAEPPVSS